MSLGATVGRCFETAGFYRGRCRPLSAMPGDGRAVPAGGGADSAVDGALPCRTVLKATVGRYFEAARLLQDQLSADNGDAGECQDILAVTFGFPFPASGPSHIHVEIHVHLDRLVCPVVPGNGCWRPRTGVRTGLADRSR